MVLAAAAPQLQPEPPVYPVLQPDTKNLPEHLRNFLDFSRERIEQDALWFLLRSSDLVATFPQASKTYHHWVASASQALIATLGLNNVMSLTPDIIGQTKRLFLQTGSERLSSHEVKACLAALDIMGLILERVRELADSDFKTQSRFANETNGLLLIASSLCTDTVAFYLRQSFPLIGDSEAKNVSTLAQWSLHYAEMVYLAWGTAELKLGLSSRMASLEKPA